MIIIIFLKINTMPSNKKKICIIGAGISGLYLTDKLKSHFNIVLIEKRNSVGGRIKTLFDKKGNVKYEGGPWRINSKHKRTIKLLHTYNMKINPISSDKRGSIKQYIDIQSPTSLNKKVKDQLKTGSFSYSDKHIFNKGLKYENDMEIKTGYMGISDSHANTTPYFSKGKYFVVEQGLKELTKRLLDTIQKVKNVKTMLKTIVIDIERKHNKYKILLDNEKFIYSDLLIIATPPHSWTSWSIYKHLKPLANCVKTNSLNHIYAKNNKIMTINQNPNFLIKTSSPLSQIISSSYNNEWFQASYSGGKTADFWFRLELESKKKFNEKLKHELFQVLKTMDIKKKEINNIQKFESNYVRHAYHIWLPKYNFKLRKMIHNSIQPHPIKCPNIYIAGEAFSSNQGWIEGALETSDKVLYAILNNIKPLKIGKKKDINFEYVIYDSRVIKVDTWKHRHPGSKQAILAYLEKDITNLFDKIHPNETSGIINSLQQYWIDSNNNIYNM